MNEVSSTLDSDELFHLALSATEADNNEGAIEYLKRAQALEPKNAKIIYMLGAVHAQIGLFDRAVEEMSKAVSLDPSIDAAHFQLGLLHITSGRPVEAEQAWEPLDKLGQENPFFLLKTGLLHLAKDEFAECVDYLKRGIAANNINEPLNRDMEKVLTAAEEALAKNDSIKNIVDKATKPFKQPVAKRLLSAYENEDEQEKH